MVNIVNYQGLNYNDVSIVPSLGRVQSRNEIPIEGYRIIIAGMSSIIGDVFLKEWMELPKDIRPLIHIPRDKNAIKNLKIIAENKLQDWVIVGLGINTPEIEDSAVKLGYSNILLDVAHGGLPQLNKVYNRLRSKFGNEANLICGCVSTEEQIAYLDNMGWDSIRLNVGSGNGCATRYVAGVAIGAFTEILNSNSYFGSNSQHNVIADGGFYQICDFAKALLAGADFCMSGYVFTKCKNAQLHIDGTEEYYGMSSSEKGVRKGQTKYDEALVKKVQNDDNKLYSLYDLLWKIWGGIRSAISYAGFSSVEEAVGNGEFCILKTPIKPMDW